MPKAGIEPARGKAPLDFESSASSSSATSARSMRGTWYPPRLAGRAARRHNHAPTKGAAGLACTTVPARKILPAVLARRSAE